MIMIKPENPLGFEPPQSHLRMHTKNKKLATVGGTNGKSIAMSMVKTEF